MKNQERKWSIPIVKYSAPTVPAKEMFEMKIIINEKIMQVLSLPACFILNKRESFSFEVENMFK